MLKSHTYSGYLVKICTTRDQYPYFDKFFPNRNLCVQGLADPGCAAAPGGVDQSDCHQPRQEEEEPRHQEEHGAEPYQPGEESQWNQRQGEE